MRRRLFFVALVVLAVVGGLVVGAGIDAITTDTPTEETDR